jgi:hypothetical protein
MLAIVDRALGIAGGPRKPALRRHLEGMVSREKQRISMALDEIKASYHLP